MVQKQELQLLVLVLLLLSLFYTANVYVCKGFTMAKKYANSNRIQFFPVNSK